MEMKNNNKQPDPVKPIEKSKPCSEKVKPPKYEQATIIMQHPDGTVERRTI